MAALLPVALAASQLLKPKPLNIAASDFTPVTNDPGVEFQPAISPDGAVARPICASGSPAGAMAAFGCSAGTPRAADNVLRFDRQRYLLDQRTCGRRVTSPPEEVACARRPPSLLQRETLLYLNPER
jgi:hypothetical protein